LAPKKFGQIEEFICFTGIHIKRLSISGLKVVPKIFQKLVNLLPNLEALELEHVKTNFPPFKSKRLRRVKMNDCTVNGSLIESLEKCVIEEAELRYSSPKELKIMEKFLKSQEKNLKKLTIDTDLNVPNNLKDLRLEYLDLYYHGRNNISLEFLRQQTDLKVLETENSKCVLGCNQCLTRILGKPGISENSGSRFGSDR
jgi:hypothetical protein